MFQRSCSKEKEKTKELAPQSNQNKTNPHFFTEKIELVQAPL
jgi:hypothetical protein